MKGIIEEEKLVIYVYATVSSRVKRKKKKICNNYNIESEIKEKN